MMNWKEFGRKRAWPNLRHNPGICLGGDLNPQPHKYEAGLITTRLLRSVCEVLCVSCRQM
jgi:hypothetical protein